MERIGVRELRQNASRWLRRVASGESFEVTDRGRPVARLVPLQEAGLDALLAQGRAQAPTTRLADLGPPLPRRREGPSLSDILTEQRAGER